MQATQQIDTATTDAPSVFRRQQLHARRGAAASAEAAAALELIDARLMATLRRIASVEREVARRNEQQRLQVMIARTYRAAHVTEFGVDYNAA